MDIKAVEVPLRAVRIYAHCGKCGARLGDPRPLFGCLELRDDGSLMHDRSYSYECPQCGEKTKSDECYPRVEIREV